MDLLGHKPEELFALSPEGLREEYGLSPAVAARLFERGTKVPDEVAETIDHLERFGVGLVTTADAHYPARLEAFEPDPPSALYIYGNTKLMQARTFAVLSSRSASSQALSRIEKLAEEGVLNAEILVTGHNRPEYMRGAVVPLRWGSPRILCLDRGLFSTLGDTLSEEPFAAARLWRYKFDPETDLALSPVRPRAGFVRSFNKVRDHLVAGLSERIDFVHIRPGGNMDRLARMALKAGRSVRVLASDPEAASYEDLGAGLLE